MGSVNSAANLLAATDFPRPALRIARVCSRANQLSDTRDDDAGSDEHFHRALGVELDEVVLHGGQLLLGVHDGTFRCRGLIITL